MDVAGIAVASGEARFGRRPNVDHVEGAVAGFPATAETGGIGEARLRVHGDGVGVAELIIVRRLLKLGWRVLHVAELGQIEDLETRDRAFDDDEGMILIHLHASQALRLVMEREFAEVLRIDRIGHLDEGGAIPATDQRELPARRGIGPTPDIVLSYVAHLARRQVREQLDIGAVENLDLAIFTGNRPAGQRLIDVPTGVRRRLGLGGHVSRGGRT